VVGLVDDLEFGAIGLEITHNGDDLFSEFLRGWMSIVAASFVIETGDDFDAGVFVLDAFEYLRLGHAHHLDNFELGFTDDPKVYPFKAFVVSSMNANTTGSCHLPLPSK
jgi:hypothetical protein